MTAWSREEERMENRYYEVIIPVSEYINDAAAPSVFFDTYEEAAAYAKPLAEQMTKVVIATREFENERITPYIEIPLDSYEYIENLATEQAGAVFKNICAYFFGCGQLEGWKTILSRMPL